MPAACASSPATSPEIPLSIASMAIWENIEELVGDDCGFSSHGTVLVAESDQELAGFRDRVDDLRLEGFTHEELIEPRRAEAPGAGGVRPLPGRRGLAPRQRRRSLPHHAGLPPPRRRGRAPM